MLSSKANVALARLKEIEEKYLKRKEQKWEKDEDSSISSISIVSVDNSLRELKESPRKVMKPKLNIKMPDTRFEEHKEETRLSSKSEKSTLDKADASKSSADARADLEVVMSLDDKLLSSVEKQESLSSDIVTIQEHTLIESMQDDSVASSKSLSHSKTPRRNFSTARDRSSGHEKIRAATRFEEGRETDKSSEIARGKASFNNLSKRPRLSRKSNGKISRAHIDPKKHSGENKTIEKTSKEMDFKFRDVTDETESRDSVIEESIDTMEDGSEIISELSNADQNSMAKIDDFVLEGSPHLADENSSSSSRSLMENGYTNDTFENISSSTVRSQHEETVDRTGYNVKKINVAEHRSYQDSTEKHRLVNPTPKPRVTKVDQGSSNYVSDLESIVANSDKITVRSIKLPQFAGSTSENQRRRYQHREASFQDKNVSSVGSSSKNTSNSSESSTGIVTKTDEKKNSPRITTALQKSGRKERGEASSRARERAMIDVTGLPVTNDEDSIKSAKSNSLLEGSAKGREYVSGESLDQRVSQDVECVLKKSHEVATKKYANSTTVTKASKSFYDNKIVSEIQNAPKTRKITERERNENYLSSERNKMSNHNHECNMKKEKKKTRIMNSKTVGTRNSTGNCKEDKVLKLDKKQMRGLRKQIAELRLQQERKDLQKYLHELKDLRPESGSTQSYFKPLEFPNVAEFMQPDDLESKPDDQFRERVLAIRRWLKDQYVLYRDYCTMAQAINAHYVPTTLDDAKKPYNNKRTVHTNGE
ncbi:hypothetical protein PUN28_012172 [Cardiocondyla obscurior]|uniref:Uncharacterized protein n=1 Tax=Cardiocondyla obscurior TaxID=286306 RepID=A0AAW2FCR9_9HYME